MENKRKDTKLETRFIADPTGTSKKYFLFLMFRHEFPVNKDLDEALKLLPEHRTEIATVERCPSGCILELPWGRTLYQRFQLSPKDRDILPCSKEQLQSCVPKKPYSLAYEGTWNPSYPLEDIGEKNEKWIAFLVDTKNHTILARSDGDLSHLNMLEVHPGHRNKGLCSVFARAIFLTLKKWSQSKISLWNIAGIPGDKCYPKAAQQAGYKYKCKYYQKGPGSCEEMEFF